MKKSMIEEILEGKDEEPSPATAGAAPAPAAPARAQQDEEDEKNPDEYRPYLIRGPVPAFDVVEAGGKRHLFAYHALKHPQHEEREGHEFIYFFGDGAYCIIQGQNLFRIWRAMQRHRLWEVRAYDGKPVNAERTRGTMIERLEVFAAHERLAIERAQEEQPEPSQAKRR